MRIAWFCVCSLVLTLAAYGQGSQPAGLTFYKTQDSDDWVRHTLLVQKTYKRVLLVSQDATPPKTIKVAATGSERSRQLGRCRDAGVSC